MKRIISFLLGFIAVIILIEIILTGMSFFQNTHRKYDKRVDSGKIIYCLGDSYTYGAGVPAEKSYPAQLDRRLRDKGYKVYNLGILGANTSIALNKLKNEIRDKGVPDIMTLMIGEANEWNFYGYDKKKYSGLSGISRFLNRLRIVRLFTLLKKYYKENKKGIESQFEPTRSEYNDIFWGNMRILNRERYDSLYYELIEKSGEIRIKKSDLNSDDVLKQKNNLAGLYYDIYFGDIDSIEPLRKDQIKDHSYEEILARSIKALYVKDLNTAFRNVEYLVQKGFFTRQVYSVASYLFKEDDRIKRLSKIADSNVEIKGTLRDNIQPLPDNIATRFADFSDPIAYQKYIIRFISKFSENIRQKDEEFKDSFAISTYNMLIRNSFSDREYYKSVSDFLQIIIKEIPKYRQEYISVIDRLLDSAYLRQQLKDSDYNELFSVYDEIISGLKDESDVEDYLICNIDYFRFLNTEKKSFLKKSFERFFKLRPQYQIFFYQDTSYDELYSRIIYDLLNEFHLYEKTKNKVLLKEISLFYLAIAEKLALDYKYDESIYLFDESIKAAEKANLSSWEQAWLYIRKNVFEEKAEKTEIDYQKTLEMIRKAVDEDPENQRKRTYLAATTVKISENKLSDETRKYIMDYSDVIQDDEDSDDFSKVESWIRKDLHDIIGICKKDDIRLILIGYPHFDNTILKNIAKENDIEYIDLYNYFQPLYKRDGIRPYILGDTHLSILGNEKLADLLEREILNGEN